MSKKCLNLASDQLEFQITRNEFESVATAFMDACLRHFDSVTPELTLGEFQLRWYLAMEEIEPLTAELRAECEALRPLLATASKSEKLRIKNKLKTLRDLDHDLRAVAENLWTDTAFAKIEAAFNEACPDDDCDDRDWFFNILAEDRAREAYGNVKLRELIEFALS